MVLIYNASYNMPSPLYFYSMLVTMIIYVHYISNGQGIKTSIVNQNLKCHSKYIQYLLFSDTNY